MFSNKFSFAELTSNDNGKTSGSALGGIYIVLIGGICFLLGCIDKMWVNKDIDIINQAIIFTTLGAGLLGIRKIVSGKIQQAKIKENEDK